MSNADRQEPYLLDANVFIEAYRRYYAFEICPGFWEFLAAYSGRGVFSIDRVRTELLDGDDLSSWVRNAPRQLFVSTIDKQVADAYSDVVGWIRGDQQYREEAKAAFFKGADGWLVAYAMAHPAVLVTHEAFSPEAKRRVPLPNVCRHFNVSTSDTFLMLRELDVRFKWVHSKSASSAEPVG